MDKEELKTLKEIFIANGYKEKVIEKRMNQVISRHNGKTKHEQSVPSKKHLKLLVLPFDVNLWQDLNATKRIYNLRIVSKPVNTIRNHLVHPKDRVPKENMCNVVYEVPLFDGNMYIGETSRPLATRLKEHADSVRKLEVDKNAIAQHVAIANAKPLWHGAKILAREENCIERRVKDALYLDR